MYAFQYQHKAKGGSLVTLWSGEARPADTYEPKLTTITVEGQFKKPFLLDLISGKISEIPKDKWKKTGNQFVFNGIPVPDYPILIADKSTLSIK